MEVNQLKKVSFKEVHKMLEENFVFLKKDINVQDFKEKGDFLSNIGFKESIATKLYNELANKQNIIQEYENKYKGLYKFILEPQLERLCEKYNLFVRPTRFYKGDIPTKNIQDLKNFRFYIEDIFDMEAKVGDLYGKKDMTKGMIFNSSKHRFELSKNCKNLYAQSFGDFYNQYLSTRVIESFNYHFAEILDKCEDGYFNGACSLDFYLKLFPNDNLLIAAPDTMFLADAFKDSKERIVDIPEIVANFQVDIDPIVLLKVNHGYLVLTAWGDEANDELIINPLNN